MRRIWLVLLVATRAAAQPSEAAQLFEEGRALAKDGKYAEACEKFAKSYELDRGVGTELNLADCREHTGHLAEAWQLFDDAAKQSEANPPRAKFARDRATALESKLATVIVKLPETAGVTVTIGGKAETPAPEIRERVDPGSIEVVVVAPGKPPYRRTQDAATGATVVFDAGTPAAPAPVDPTPSSPRHGRLVLALGLGGGGVVLLGTSAVIGLVAKSGYDSAVKDYNACTDGGCASDALSRVHHEQSVADIATGFFVGGAALLAAGAVLYLTAPHETVIAPTATPTSVGLAATGRF